MSAGLDEGAVSRALSAHLGAAVRCRRVERGAVGNGQETWFVDADVDGETRPLVIRRTAAGGPLMWTDRRREYEALRAAGEAGLPVPTVHGIDDSGATLGRPYFVMDRVEGVPGTHRDVDRNLVAAELGNLLGRLHTAAIAAPGAPQGLTATEATSNEVAAWRTRYLADRPAPYPMVGALFAWLGANLPSTTGPAVQLWGDPGPHNVLVCEGVVSGMLDWELSHAGDPAEDLGTVLWFYGGSIDPAVLLQAYAATTGIVPDPEAVRFYEAMACVTRSVMVLSGVSAYIRGDTDEPPAAALGIDLLHANLARAARLAGWGDLPPVTLPDDPAESLIHPSPDQVDGGVARYLRSAVLDEIDDRRTRRGVKTAIALLEANAVRDRHEVAALARHREDVTELTTEIAAMAPQAPEDLEELAVAVETDPEASVLRGPVRRLLLRDLAVREALTTPLRALYRPRKEAP